MASRNEQPEQQQNEFSGEHRDWPARTREQYQVLGDLQKIDELRREMLLSLRKPDGFNGVRTSILDALDRLTDLLRQKAEFETTKGQQELEKVQRGIDELAEYINASIEILTIAAEKEPKN